MKRYLAILLAAVAIALPASLLLTQCDTSAHAATIMVRGPVVTASAAFVPTQIAGCKLWLDASQIVGLSDGDPVSTWADASGQANDATQGTSGNRPTYQTAEINSLPVVRFTTDDFLAGSISGIGNDASFFVVEKISSGTNNALVDLSDSSSTNRCFNFFQESSLMKFRAGGGGNETTFSYSNNSWHVLDAIQATAARSLFLDGSVQDTNGSTQNPAAAPSNYRVGALFGGFYSLDGDIAEIIIYDSSLGTTDRDAVEAYLGTKYGITVADASGRDRFRFYVRSAAPCRVPQVMASLFLP